LDSNEIISSGLLELYVMGQTTELETQQVLQWKAMYPQVAEELLSIENALEQYALANAVEPSTSVKENILQSIHQDNAVSENKVVSMNTAENATRSNKWKLAAAASIALLIGTSISSLLFYNKYKKANNELDVAKQELSLKNEQTLALQKNMDIILASNSQPIVLKGTPTAPTSTAKIFWIKNTEEVYVEASGLPEAPQGLQYQLWAIIDDKPVDGGMILQTKKGDKYQVQKMKSFGKAQAFAITLEKEGGSPTPTPNKMYVMSTT
jgi:Anti-sigma-K factor rskA